jgi:hypothetical protein
MGIMMNRKNVKFLVVFSVLLMVFSGCGENGKDGKEEGTIKSVGSEPEDGTFPGLDAETELRITQEWGKFYKYSGNVEMLAYLGTYNDWVAAVFNVVPSNILYSEDWEKQKGGFKDEMFPNRRSIITVWEPGAAGDCGNFYRLGRADELGLVTEDDRNSIYDRYKDYLFELREKGQDWTPPDLDLATEIRIRQDYLDFEPPHGEKGPFTADNVIIEGFFGAYNGCMALMVDLGMSIYAGFRADEVAGVTFGYRSTPYINIWKPGDGGETGSFYRLNEAYNSGLLTEGDIKSMYDRFKDPRSYRPENQGGL